MRYNRPETPPNIPQHHQTAVRQSEHDNRILESPQRHCTPYIPPLHFGNIPVPHVPENAPIPDDPFVLRPVPGPMNFNGHLAQQLQDLPAFPPPLPSRGRGRGGGHGHQGHIALVSVDYFCFL